VLLVPREAGIAAEAEESADPPAGVLVIYGEPSARAACFAANGATTLLGGQHVDVVRLRESRP